MASITKKRVLQFVLTYLNKWRQYSTIINDIRQIITWNSMIYWYTTYKMQNCLWPCRMPHKVTSIHVNTCLEISRYIGWDITLPWPIDWLFYGFKGVNLLLPSLFIPSSFISASTTKSSIVPVKLSIPTPTSWFISPFLSSKYIFSSIL